MKKYKIIICIVITIIITGVGVGAYQNHKQEQREAYVRGLYRHQWLAYPNEKRERYIYEYNDYSIINEKRLFVYLSAHNANNDKYDDHCQIDLTLDDVKEYLSDPYNEDGTLRVETGWDKMYAFEDWHSYVGKKQDIPEYETALINEYAKFLFEHNINDSLWGDLSVEQLSELVRKVSDPTYEINPEVMGY